MKYIINNIAPEHVNGVIIEGVEQNKDVKGSAIDTWEVRKTTSGEKVLVHTVPAWVNKGCIMLKAYEKEGKVSAVFHYWTSCEEDDKNPDDNKYMLGRFTELMLVHFENCFDSITIEQ